MIERDVFVFVFFCMSANSDDTQKKVWTLTWQLSHGILMLSLKNCQGNFKTTRPKIQLPCVFPLRGWRRPWDQPPPRNISQTVGGISVKYIRPHSLKHWAHIRFTSILSTGPMLTWDQSPRATKQLGRTMSVEAPKNCRGARLPSNTLSFPFTSQSSFT